LGRKYQGHSWGEINDPKKGGARTTGDKMVIWTNEGVGGGGLRCKRRQSGVWGGVGCGLSQLVLGPKKDKRVKWEEKVLV